MILQVRIMSLVISVLFVVYVVWLVRNRKLRETVGWEHKTCWRELRPTG